MAKIDSGDTYTADARAITRFVSRYIEDQLNEEELEQIGDLLEGAEFIEYVGPGSDGIIAQVVFQMSTPTAKGPISKEAAERWLGPARRLASQRRNLNARGLQPAPDDSREIRGARRVAVQANRVGLQRDRRAIDARRPVLSFTIRTARSTTAFASWITLPGLRARGQRAVAFVGAIGEHFRGHRQAGGFTGAQQFRVRQAKQDQRAIERGHRAWRSHRRARDPCTPCCRARRAP